MMRLTTSHDFEDPVSHGSGAIGSRNVDIWDEGLDFQTFRVDHPRVVGG